MNDGQGPSLRHTRLHRRLVASVGDFLAKVHQTQEQLYGFALLPSHRGDFIQAAAMTEEALARSVEAVSQLSKLELHSEAERAALRAALRWSGPGDGWYTQCNTEVTDVRQWFSTALEDGELTGANNQVNQLCSGVLQDLDQQGAFGRGEERAEVVLGLWDQTQSDAAFLRWAEMLNPAPVVARLRQELDQMRAAQSVGRPCISSAETAASTDRT